MLFVVSQHACPACCAQARAGRQQHRPLAALRRSRRQPGSVITGFPPGILIGQQTQWFATNTSVNTMVAMSAAGHTVPGVGRLEHRVAGLSGDGVAKQPVSGNS